MYSLFQLPLLCEGKLTKKDPGWGGAGWGVGCQEKKKGKKKKGGLMSNKPDLQAAGVLWFLDTMLGGTWYAHTEASHSEDPGYMGYRTFQNYWKTVSDRQSKTYRCPHPLRKPRLFCVQIYASWIFLDVKKNTCSMCEHRSSSETGDNINHSYTVARLNMQD